MYYSIYIQQSVLYFISTHQINVKKFSNYYFPCYTHMIQVSSLVVCTGSKNSRYTNQFFNYYCYHNLPPLDRKKIGTYFLIVNPKL